ncbi:MAG: N-acetylmuramoyl-L-alanine amidase [Nannocystaceae bacterium]
MQTHTKGWQKRRNRSWSGIPLYDRRRKRVAPRRVVLHQWGVTPGLGKWARKRIASGATTEEQEYIARAQRAPYHIAIGRDWHAQVWPLDLHTHHAGARNAATIGIGALGEFPRFGRAPDFERQLTAALRALAANGPIHVETHSQSSRKARDPGEWAIHAIAPLVAEGLVTCDPDWSAGHGQPWPPAWRDALALARCDGALG